jgi:signal-transduction protein with cAMP-binding, CBS, and nucleotidyltransferase domain
MALNFSIVHRFVSEYGETMRDRTLLRHDRYAILAKLRETLWEALRESERFESELSGVLNAVESTGDYEALRTYHLTAVAGIRTYFLEEETVADVHDLFRIVRDKLTVRVLKLVEDEMDQAGFGPCPCRYCWIGLGSEGRDEQTFVTDQDSMLVYDGADRLRITDALKRRCGLEGGMNGAAPSVLLRCYYQEFCSRVTERLHHVGFEKCKGGIMPSNEKWRGSVEDWTARIEQTLTQGKGTLELLDLIILTDARVILGEQELFKRVLDRFFSLLKENRQVMKEIAEASVMMPTALGFFGKFRVEPSGDHKGSFNLKVFGWSPLVMSVRALSLAEGLHETNTLRRIKELRAINMVSKDTAEDLIDAYLLFARFRLMKQMEGATRRDGLNYLDPALQSVDEAGRLRKAMRTVETFQKYLQQVILFGQPL